MKHEGETQQVPRLTIRRIVPPLSPGKTAEEVARVIGIVKDSKVKRGDTGMYVEFTGWFESESKAGDFQSTRLVIPEPAQSHIAKAIQKARDAKPQKQVQFIAAVIARKVDASPGIELYTDMVMQAEDADPLAGLRVQSQRIALKNETDKKR